MPWAALAHCCFGLWMHTYFRTETQQLLTAWIPGLAGNSTLPADSRSDLGALTASALWARVSQTNGLPLLILVVTGVVVLILMRWDWAGAGLELGSEEGGLPAVTMRADGRTNALSVWVTLCKPAPAIAHAAITLPYS